MADNAVRAFSWSDYISLETVKCSFGVYFYAPFRKFDF